MMTGLLWEAPSRFGWLIIALAAVINQIRVTISNSVSVFQEASDASTS